MMIRCDIGVAGRSVRVCRRLLAPNHFFKHDLLVLFDRSTVGQGFRWLILRRLHVYQLVCSVARPWLDGRRSRAHPRRYHLLIDAAKFHQSLLALPTCARPDEHLLPHQNDQCLIDAVMPMNLQLFTDWAGWYLSRIRDHLMRRCRVLSRPQQLTSHHARWIRRGLPHRF